MSVAGVKKPRLKAITAIVPAIADISTSPMMGFFRPQEEVIAAKEAYDKGGGELMYLNFMPRAFDEGAAYYYSARGTQVDCQASATPKKTSKGVRQPNLLRGL